MKKGKLIVCLVLGIALTAGLAGCRITSAKPDTTVRIVLKPGQTQVFAVDGIDLILKNFLPLFDEVGFDWKVNDGDVWFEYVTTKHAMGIVSSTFSYIPAPDDAGINTIEAQLGIWHTPLDCPICEYFSDATDSHVWKVEVWGIARDPLQDHLVMAHGTTQTLVVKPCPVEGEYTYQWFMDGNPIPNVSTANFDFTPGPGDIGTHIVGVEAAGWDDGSEFTQAWEIEVS
jgi:hypothetical protein